MNTDVKYMLVRWFVIFFSGICLGTCTGLYLSPNNVNQRIDFLSPRPFGVLVVDGRVIFEFGDILCYADDVKFRWDSGTSMVTGREYQVSAIVRDKTNGKTFAHDCIVSR